MLTNALKKSYPIPPVNRSEIFRYAGCPVPGEEENCILDECLSELLAPGMLRYDAVLCRMPIDVFDEVCSFPGFTLHSAALAESLTGCHEALLFGCTIGLFPDILIRKYGITAPVKGLMIQAAGAERVEALCDAICDEYNTSLAKEGFFLKARFSPGYGDLALETQTEFFRVLPLSAIGLTLNTSYLMSPTKSVTAVAGICPGGKASPDFHCNSSCSACSMLSCPYRKQ